MKRLILVLALAAIMICQLLPQTAKGVDRIGGFLQLIASVPDKVVKFTEFYEQLSAMNGGGGSGGNDFNIWEADGFYITTNVFGNIAGITVLGFDNTVVNGNNYAATVPDFITGLSPNALPVTVIFDYAFTQNPGAALPNANIASLIIGNQLALIGNHALDVPALTNITVFPDNLKFSSLDGVLFNANKTVLLRFPQGLTGSYTVPGTVTDIADYAFYKCSGLTNLIVGANVTSIGVNAFASNGLKSVFFVGNAPKNNGTAFAGDQVTVYYLSGTSGWGPNYGGVGTTMYNPFNYTIQNDRVTIVGFTGLGWTYPGSPTVIIPPAINGLPVTAIGANAFSHLSSMQAVVIPGSVISIGSGAFDHCTALASVTMGTNVASIGMAAFNCCSSLASLDIPSGVKSLAANLLTGCTNLASLTIGTNVTSIGDRALAVCSRLGMIHIPASVTSIGSQAFYHCTQLGFDVAPDNLYWSSDSVNALLNKAQTTLIQFNAGLQGCYFLPDTVVNIAEQAFFGSARLGSVYIPASVTSIGNQAFAGCSSLSGAYFSGNQPGNDGSAFVGDTSLVYYLPGASGWTTSYGGAATRLWIQYGYTTNSNNTITLQQYVGPGGNVTLPSSMNGRPVTGFAPDMFANLNTLTGITIPNSVSNIVSGSFSDCYALTTVVLGSGVTNIGAGAFANCAALTSLNIPNNITSIGSGAFSGCGLTDIVIGTGLTTLADNLFYNCALQSVTIPSTVTRIGSATFAGNPLRSVIIPGNVRSLGAGAFRSCDLLANVYFQGDAPVNDGTAFWGDNQYAGSYSEFYNSANTYRNTLVNYLPGTAGWGASYGTVPAALLPLTYTNVGGFITITKYSGSGNVPVFSAINGVPVTGIGSGAFRDCAGLTGVFIPGSIGNIGGNAFENCAGLTNFVVASANPNYCSVNNVLFDKAQTVLIQFPGGLGGAYTVPGTVTTIGPGAFEGSKVTSVTIPAGVVDVGLYAFKNCSLLTNLAVASANPGYTNMANVLFNKAQTVLIQFPGGLGGTYTVPGTVTNIGPGAFSGSKVSAVNVPAGVRSIAVDALAACGSLINIAVNPSNPNYATVNGILFNPGRTTLLQFPGGLTGSCLLSNNVTSIGASAFAGCSLASVTFPTNLTSIGANAFAGCTKLMAANFFGDAPADDGAAFMSSRQAVVYYLSGTTGWGSTFGGARTMNIPYKIADNGDNTLTLTGYYGSDNYLTIPSMIFGEPVTRIGDSAFKNNMGLTSIVFPASVTHLGARAFMGCGNLTYFSFAGVSGVDIGSDAFTFCSKLAAVSLPAGASSIGNYAFAECTSLSQVNFGGATNIGDCAFADCTALKFVLIGTHVTRIGASAFVGSGLQQLDVPAGVVEIGTGAFAYCGQTNVNITAYFMGNAPLNDGTAFAHGYASVIYEPGTSGWGSTYGGASAIEIPAALTFSFSEEQATVTGIHDLFGSVTIPMTVVTVMCYSNNMYYTNYFAVTAIGDNAFANDQVITSVTIPNTVTRIGKGAFQNCTNLTRVVLPDTIVSIGEAAFSNCVHLTGITMPAALTNLGANAFASCPGVFSLSFGSGFINLGSGAFNSCTNLSSLYFAGDAPITGGAAFTGDSLLTLYALPGAAGWGTTFNGTPVADWIQFICKTNNDNTITLWTYTGTDGNVTLPARVNGLPVTCLAESLFANCKTLSSITLPNSITNIGNYAFYGCGFLTNATLSINLTSIGWDAFYYCSRLKSITIPASLTDIGPWAFAGCGLTNVVLPGTVTSIGSSAFYLCPMSGSILIPRGVKYIGNNAFDGLSSFYFEGNAPAISSEPFLHTYYTYVQNGYTYFGGYGHVYYDASTVGWGDTFGGLTTAVWTPYSHQISNNVVIITGYAGSGGNITVPKTIGGLTVAGVAANAFASNSSLTRVNLPGTVTSVGRRAFAGSTNLTAVYFKGNAPGNDGSAFSGDSATVYYLNATTGWSSTFGGANTVAYDPFGAITVTINPPSAGGQWRVDGGQWQASGAIADNLSPGYHTVSFSTPGGIWETPLSQTILVSGLGAVSSIGTYAVMPFTYAANNDNTLTLTGYSGAGGMVYVPHMINGVTVTGIGPEAFRYCTTFTSVIIPDTITNMGASAFANCSNLTSVTVGTGVTHLASLVFAYCPALVSIFFDGDAPTTDGTAFTGDVGAVVYYVGGNTNWSSTLGGLPAALVPYTFEINSNSTVTITGYTGGGGNVIIPARIGGLPVVGIGGPVFCGNGSLTGVSLPDSMKSIGWCAFYNCTNLTRVTFSTNSYNIPGVSFYEIGQYAFGRCHSLTNLTISDSVTSIGYGAFQEDGELRRVVVGNGVTTIKDYAFAQCSNLSSLTLGIHVANIGYQAFAQCSSLSNVVCPDALTDIGGGAFMFCSSLTSVTFGSGMAGIGKEAFIACTSLQTLRIPAGVHLIGGNAFSSCSSLTSVTFQGQVPLDILSTHPFQSDSKATLYYQTANSSCFNGWVAPALNYDYLAAIAYTVNSDNTVTLDHFAGSSGLKGSLPIPVTVDGLTVSAIAAHALDDNSGNPVIGANITRIGHPLGSNLYASSITVDPVNPCYSSVNGVLFDKSQTTLITYPVNANLSGSYAVPASVTGIVDYAFAGCRLNDVTLSPNVTAIGAGAFAGSIYLCKVATPNPDGLKTLGVSVFDNCLSLTTFNTGNNLGALPAFTFRNCSNLTSVALGGSISGIGESAFANCVALPRVTFPDGLNSINAGAFANCRNLTKLIFPAGVLANNYYYFHVGAGAFAGCTGLTAAYFKGDAPIPDYGTAFAGDSLATAYYLSGSHGWMSSFGGAPTALYAPVGSVQVMTYPEYMGGAQWSLDGSQFQDSGTTLTNIPAGSHTISFAEVNGLLTPSNQVVNVGNLAAVVTSGTYGQSLYGFTVNGDHTVAITACSDVGSGNVTIPDTINGMPVTSIGQFAFNNKGSLRSVRIPDTVTSIGSSAFNNCVNLVYVTMGTNVASIGIAAFYGCQSLLTVTIPDSVVSVGSSAFANCTNLVGAVVGSGIDSMGNTLFAGDSNLSAVYFNGAAPSGLPWAFQSNGSLSHFYYQSGKTGWTSATIGGVSTALWTSMYSFRTNTDNTITITRYNSGDDFQAMVPPVINGLPVTMIGDEAFRDVDQTVISLPASVTSLGEKAFAGSYISQMYLSGGITNIGKGAFYYCYYLATITVDAANPTYTDVNGVLFDKSQTSLIQFPGAWGGDPNVGVPYNIPAAVSQIEDWAFYGSCLSKLTIPASVTSIGSAAFSDTYLTDITVDPANPAFIVANSALLNKTKTRLIQFFGPQSGIYFILPGVTTIGEGSFQRCNLTGVFFPPSVTSIGANAFSFSASLSSAVLPDGLTSIGANAFSRCETLRTAVLPDGITSIAAGLFTSCSSLTSVFIPSGVTNIGHGAFDCCWALSSISIPPGVTRIEDWAFGETGLASITIPDGVVDIGDWAFGFCYSLRNVHIGAGVTNIGDCAFYQDICIERINIPDSVVSIGSQAFYWCNGMQSATIGANVSSIGRQAFGGGYSSYFSAMYFHGNAPAYDRTPFEDEGCRLTIYYLPGTSGWGTDYCGRPTVMMSEPPPTFACATNADNTLTITAYNSDGGNLSLPGEINGRTVTGIGSSAFENYAQSGYTMGSVTIPASVTNIANGAFARAGITNFAVDPSNPTYASTNGSLITRPPVMLIAVADTAIFTLSAGITNLAPRAFYGCRHLTCIDVDPANPAYASADGVLFNKHLTALIQYPLGLTGGGYDVPDTVVSIGDSAFEASDLDGVRLPASVTNLGSRAFADNWGLISVYVEGSAVPDDGTAFINCTYASLYYLADTNWGSAFCGIPVTPWLSSYTWKTNVANAIMLTRYTDPGRYDYIMLPRAINGLPLRDISSVFAGIGLTGITIPSGIGAIVPDAFNGTYLESLHIPSTVTNIGDNAFLGCDLPALSLPVSVTHIGSSAFADNQIRSVTIPSSVTSIGDSAFARNEMTSLTLAPGVTTIGASAFADNKLVSIAIPATTTNLGDYAFANNYGLTRVTIPNGVRLIGNSAFENSSVTELVIPDTVEIIGDSAFSGHSLTTLTIPASVTSIGDSAFTYGSLVEVFFLGDAPANDNGTALSHNDRAAIAYYLAGASGWSSIYGGVPAKATSEATVCTTNADNTIAITRFIGIGAVTIPATINGLPVTVIAADAFGSFASVTRVSIPATVTNIDLAAFAGCAGLTNIIVDPANPVYSTTNGVLFNKSQTVLLQCPPGVTGTYAIPCTVTNIGEDAFEGCAGLTNVVFPAGLTCIGDPAFGFCVNLTTLRIPASVTYIGDYAFAFCDNLTSVYFDGDAPADNGTVFFNDLKATVYYLPDANGWGSTFGSVPTARLQGPSALPTTVYRTHATVQIPFISLAAAWSDPDGLSPVALAGVNRLSTNLVILTTNASGIVYTTSRDVSDQIVYSITNSRGMRSTAVINIIFNANGEEILTVVSAHGGAYPGTVSTNSGTFLSQRVTSSPISGGVGTQYVCTAGIVTGNDSTQISATNVTLTLTNTATLTWLWKTQYLAKATAGAHGTVAPTNALWVDAGGSAVPYTAIADSGFGVDKWSVNAISVQTGGSNFTAAGISGLTGVQVTFVPTTIEPRISILSPTNRAVLTTTRVSIVAQASDSDGLSEVCFYNGTNHIGTTNLPGGTLSWSNTFVWVGALIGSNTLTAEAFDIFGNSTTSTAVVIRVTPTARLFWQLPTGQVAAWVLNTNGTMLSSYNIYTNTTTWQVNAAGDLDNDGVSDLVWQFSTGPSVCWTMNTDGTRKSSLRIYNGTTIWQIRGVGDIDGDGVADLVWQLPTGQVACWFMNANGTRRRGIRTYTGTTAWIISGAGDIDGDGIADLIWQLPTGQVACWLMKADGTLRECVKINNSTTSWIIRGVGDVDGDGFADLVWQLPTGQVACWYMKADGTLRASVHVYTGTTSWLIRCAGW